MISMRWMGWALLVATAVCGQDYMNDVSAIRAILDSNKLSSLSLESIATTENGRVVRLDLTNKDVVKTFVQRVPADIGKLTALRYLSLKDNLIPSLPETIGNLTALKEIDLSGNDLSSLPASFANLKALEKAKFESNEFEEVPAALLKLPVLWYLQLRSNNLTTLPEGIAGMTSLKELYLGRNKISSLPRSVMKLKLSYFEHLENKLCSLPADLDAWLKNIDKRYKEYQKCW